MRFGMALVEPRRRGWREHMQRLLKSQRRSGVSLQQSFKAACQPNSDSP